MKQIFLQAMMGFGMLFMGCCAWVLVLLVSIVSIRADSLADPDVKRKKVKRKITTIILIVVLLSLLMLAMGSDDHPIN